MHLDSIQRGDIVDVVAPASACTKAELEQSIQAILKLGLVPRVPKDIFAKSVLFANSDEKRLAQLRAALYAADSKMIWCVRGGYGSIRLMPQMEKWKKPKRPKLVLGFSDITTLHRYLNQSWGWPTIHGPNADRLGRGQVKGAERQRLLSLLFGRDRFAEFKGLKALNLAAQKKRVIHGPILGGNMAVLQSGLGTPSCLKPKGAILFFEDIGERPHRMDRMLVQFEQAGWFREAKAVLLGDFVLNDPKDRRELWSDVVRRFAQSQKIPVLAGLPVGHNPNRQWPLPFNTPAKLITGDSAQLWVQNPVRTS